MRRILRSTSMPLVERVRPRRPVNLLGGDSQGGFVVVPERDVVGVSSIAWIRLWESVLLYEREPKKSRR